MQVKIKNGGVGEWLNPAVLKTVRPERVSGVRIPPPPPSIGECREVFGMRCPPQWARVLNISNTLLRVESAALSKLLAEPFVQNPKPLCDVPVPTHEGAD